MLTLLSRTKSFRDPWVGQPALNQRWQLHRRRVQPVSYTHQTLPTTDLE